MTQPARTTPPESRIQNPESSPFRILITGAGGMLAHAVRQEFEQRGHDVAALDRAALDITDQAAVATAVGDVRPHAVVHCAAYTRVDDAEREEDRAFLVNATGAGHVASACRAIGARFVYPSTDYVFDGTATEPYAPADRPNPLGAYGRSKLAGEVAAREAGDYLIARTSWLYGAGGRNFVDSMIERARAGERLRVVDDQRGSPTWTGTFARVLADLIEARAPGGVYHIANRGETTWYGLAREAIRLAGIDAELTPVTSDEFRRPAPRPAYSVLDVTATETVIGEIEGWREALEMRVAEMG